MLLSSFLLLSCDEEKQAHTFAQSLVGKSKQEVIAMAFKKAERVLDNEVNFIDKVYTSPTNWHHSNHRFSSEEEALQSELLLKSNEWGIHLLTKRNPFRTTRYYIIFTFKDNRATSYSLRGTVEGF